MPKYDANAERAADAYRAKRRTLADEMMSTVCVRIPGAAEFLGEQNRVVDYSCPQCITQPSL